MRNGFRPSTSSRLPETSWPGSRLALLQGLARRLRELLLRAGQPTANQTKTRRKPTEGQGKPAETERKTHRKPRKNPEKTGQRSETAAIRAISMDWARTDLCLGELFNWFGLADLSSPHPYFGGPFRRVTRKGLRFALEQLLHCS